MKKIPHTEDRYMLVLGRMFITFFVLMFLVLIGFGVFTLIKVMLGLCP